MSDLDPVNGVEDPHLVTINHEGKAIIFLSRHELREVTCMMINSSITVSDFTFFNATMSFTSYSLPMLDFSTSCSISRVNNIMAKNYSEIIVNNNCETFSHVVIILLADSVEGHQSIPV